MSLPRRIPSSHQEGSLETSNNRQVLRHNCAYCFGNTFIIITVQKNDTTQLYAMCADDDCRAEQIEKRNLEQRQLGKEETDEMPTLMVLTVDPKELNRDFKLGASGDN